MSNLCKQYVENELNCYRKKLYDITNEIHSTEIDLKTVDKNLIFMNADHQLVISDAVSKLYEAGADGIVCMDDVI